MKGNCKVLVEAFETPQPSCWLYRCCGLTQQPSTRQPFAQPSTSPPAAWGGEWTKGEIHGLR